MQPYDNSNRNLAVPPVFDAYDNEAAREAWTAQVATDSWEAICDKGRAASDALDSGRWILGELAATVETHYGEKNIEQFAIQIMVEKARVWEYKRVYSFYEKFATANYREENPMLRYSHFRDAMRLGDGGKAMTFLDMCSLAGLTVEQARLKLVELMGKPLPPKKVMEFNVTGSVLKHVILNDVVSESVDKISPDKDYRVTIHEVAPDGARSER